MSTSLIQQSFASGEISVDASARTDLARYQTGLATCRNFFISQYGGALNRAGLYFLSGTHNNKLARLISFKFSTSDTYALEFTDGIMRVYRNGGLVEASPGVPYTMAHPFNEAELFDIRYTQSADIMIMVHPNHKPQKLSRFAHNNWTIGDISLVPSIAAPSSATATPNAGGSASTTQTWRYQITAVKDDGTQTIEESLPVTSNSITVKTDNLNASVTWAAVAGANYYNVYKDNAGAGVFGFIGKATTTSFSDNNITPTKTDTPPTGADPFVGANNYPSAVAFYQQRLTFGATNNKPQTLWFSKTGVFFNFGYSTPQKDDDSIIWTMASTEVNRIQHLTPLAAALGTFTDGAEWLIQGTTAGFTPKTINGSQQTSNGIGDVKPILINNQLLYTQERGKSVIAFGYSLNSDGFTGNDISILSSHLLQQYGITDWAYQKIPNSIIWGVREDGAMLGLTYVAEQEVIAWHRHDTDGQFKSVCAIPEGREDSLYCCVQRVIGGVTKYYVERMASRNLPRLLDTPDVRQAFFVDSGLTYDGTNKTGTTITLTGGTDWKYPEVVTATASAALFSAGDVGKQIQYSGNLFAESVRLEIISFTSSTVVQVRPFGKIPDESRNVASIFWAWAITTLSGLSHLEGKGVSILADGNVETSQIVTGGSVTISTPSAIIHVGLPYTSELETLELNVPNAETLQDKHKIISKVTAVFKESRGGFVGTRRDGDNLFEIKQRDDADDYNTIALQTGKSTISVTDTWEGRGKVIVRQVDPLPFNVLALIPQVDVGGSR